MSLIEDELVFKRAKLKILKYLKENDIDLRQLPDGFDEALPGNEHPITRSWFSQLKAELCVLAGLISIKTQTLNTSVDLQDDPLIITPTDKTILTSLAENNVDLVSSPESYTINDATRLKIICTRIAGLVVHDPDGSKTMESELDGKTLVANMQGLFIIAYSPTSPDSRFM